ncbi:Mitogen-activated protein kinase kinase kinase [Musa troglodytarum]|uniref:Mitogen-activated protein kinase kinase kinase n=1 Tax=Musa troglodytarum TaxID=320322 RepID=A0A9E7J9S3_9LILI|nr:Mitogen-activated protein kinase kinase kinase [Musa troglodytarum]
MKRWENEQGGRGRKKRSQWMKRRKVDLQAYLLVVHGERGKMDNNRGKMSEEGSQIRPLNSVINPRRSYGPAADIWSLGCTVLEMLTRQIPYPNLEWTQALYRIGHGEQPSIPSSLSKDALFKQKSSTDEFGQDSFKPSPYFESKRKIKQRGVAMFSSLILSQDDKEETTVLLHINTSEMDPHELPELQPRMAIKYTPPARCRWRSSGIG